MRPTQSIFHMTRQQTADTPFDSNKPCPCGLHGLKYGECCEHKGADALGNAMLRGTMPRLLEGTRTETLSSMVMGDTRHRIVWNKVWYSPQEQTFHNFLDGLVVATFGLDWFEQQSQLAAEQQHVVERWRIALLELVDRPEDTAGGHTFTGPVESYMHLGYDLYWLQIHHKLPDALIERLRTREKFQGVRYEILVAAVFTRAGFDIQWLDDNKTMGKHCEFIATHKATGTKIAIETKSRQRSGALHFRGVVSPEPKADIFERYEDAVRQVPTDGTPSLIFLDTNWKMPLPLDAEPYGAIPRGTYPWVDEIRSGLDTRWKELNGTTPETGVVFTNYSYYYGTNDEPSPLPIVGGHFSPKPTTPINDRRALDDLFYCLRHYDYIPRQV